MDKVDTQVPETTTDAKKEVKSGDGKVFTQEELNKILSARLADATAKLQKDWEVKMQEQLAEQERLAKLSQEEREKEILEQSKREIEEREKKVARQENELRAYQEFTSRQLPVELAPQFVRDTQEDTIKSIEDFEKAFKSSLTKAVEDKLKGTAPKDVKTNTAVPEVRTTF